MSKSDFAQQVAKLFEGAGNNGPAELHELAQFAVERGLFEPKKEDVIKQCAEILAQGFRETYIRDREGRRVRRYHAVRRRTEKGDQLVFWGDILSSPREHMETSFGQRRKDIMQDCLQLKKDVDSYNDAHINEPPIQLVLDFTEDIHELLEPSPKPTPAAPSSSAR